jgi:hypothetical protein
VTENECVRFQIRDAWISYQLGNQIFGSMNEVKGVPSGNQIWYQSVYEKIDVLYAVYEPIICFSVSFLLKRDLQM